MRALRASLPTSETPRALTVDERAALRQLAADFPGALRELDAWATDEIARRYDEVQSWLGAPTESPPRWMVWTSRYHVLMKQALAVRAVPRRAEFDWTAWCAGQGIDFAFAGAALAPPGGRLMVAVFRQLATEFAVAEDELWSALFPLRGAARSYRGRSFAG